MDEVPRFWNKEKCQEIHILWRTWWTCWQCLCFKWWKRMAICTLEDESTIRCLIYNNETFTSKSHVFEIGLKYEYLHETKINIFFSIFNFMSRFYNNFFKNSQNIILKNNHSWCLYFLNNYNFWDLEKFKNQ